MAGLGYNKRCAWAWSCARNVVVDRELWDKIKPNILRAPVTHHGAGHKMSSGSELRFQLMHGCLFLSVVLFRDAHQHALTTAPPD